MTAAVLLLGMAVAILAVLVVGLLRSHADVLRALHGLGAHVGREEPGLSRADPVTGFTVPGVPDGRRDLAPPTGGVAPVDITGLLLDGEVARVALVGAHRATLLAFLTTGCASCVGVWRDIGAEPVGSSHEQVVIVTRGPELESPGEVARMAPAGVTVLQSTEAWDAFGVAGAPYFVLVDASGAIAGEGSAAAWDQVRGLLDRAISDRASSPQRRTRREVLTGRQREELVDRELRGAGIHPGDPSLFPPATGPEGSVR